MKILYLCERKMFKTKMSRVRFHGMAAIADKTDFIYSGNGWDNYDSSKTVNENISQIYGGDQPDLIVAYKPDNFKGFSDSVAPRCIRYNEMWPIKEWTKELARNKIDLVIAHHLNDIPKYDHVEDVVFEHVAHCANADIYKDYGEEKVYDVLFTGAVSQQHYPFRVRLLNLVKNRLDNKLNCKVMGHPGGRLRRKMRGYIDHDYAKEINKAKLTLTCSSIHKYRLGKYVEIPMSGSVLAGDVPGQDQEEFQDIMLVLDPNDSDDVLVDKIVKACSDEEWLSRKKEAGLEWSKNYTQEKYADRFLSVAEGFLEGKKG